MAHTQARRDLDYDTGTTGEQARLLAGPMFFGPSDTLVFRQEFPEMVMDPFEDDLSGMEGHR